MLLTAQAINHPTDNGQRIMPSPMPRTPPCPRILKKATSMLSPLALATTIEALLLLSVTTGAPAPSLLVISFVSTVFLSAGTLQKI